jgi:hypothetical protein
MSPLFVSGLSFLVPELNGLRGSRRHHPVIKALAIPAILWVATILAAIVLSGYYFKIDTYMREQDKTRLDRQKRTVVQESETARFVQDERVKRYERYASNEAVISLGAKLRVVGVWSASFPFWMTVGGSLRHHR